MRTSRKTDFRNLEITLVSMTYHSQPPKCPPLSPHVLLIRNNIFVGKWMGLKPGGFKVGFYGILGHYIHVHCKLVLIQ